MSKKQSIRFKIDGYSRYKFDLKGNCYTSITGDPVSSESGCYMLMNDKRIREPVTIQKVLEVAKEKSCSIKKQNSKLTLQDAIDIHELHENGKTSKELAITYKRHVSAINKILAGTIYPKALECHTEKMKQSR